MSEFYDPIEILKHAGPEVVFSVQELHEERQDLYEWLALKVRQNVPAYEYNTRAGTRIVEVAGSFSEMAIEVTQNIEDHKSASLVIASDWANDETDRNQRFSALSHTTKFQQLERESIDLALEDIFQKAGEDTSEIVKGMYDGYFDSLMCDVTKLLQSVHLSQEKVMQVKLKNVPLSTPESTHVAASLKFLREKAGLYGGHILSLWY